nr:MAG TPA: hypothetical protein [Caudoviricetes sp.]
MFLTANLKRYIPLMRKILGRFLGRFKRCLKVDYLVFKVFLRC